jgi:leader peptidase (prepilin peptidase)/N-methyltransferase
VEILFYFIIFLFGLAIGSFLNSIIYRLQTGESFLIQRSYCPNCKKSLGWQDLIPLLSFIFLKGKCRYCQGKISWQYPLVEFATGLLFVFIFYQNMAFLLSGFFDPWIIKTSFLLVISCFLIIIFVSDLKYYIIPDKVIYPAIGTAFLYQLFGNWKYEPVVSLPVIAPQLREIGNLEPLINPLLSAVLASAFFLLIVLVSRGKWMGWGDPKLAFFMGLFLGFPNILVSLFLAFLIGAIMGVGLIISGRKTLKSEVPFGPFLIVGTFIAFFWGGALINRYLSLFWRI